MSSEHRSDWGRLNAGQYYGILAVDVDRALACAHMTIYEQVVMQYARERCWGKSTLNKGGRAKPWPEPVPLVWDLRRIAEETGMPANRLSEAKSSLVRSRMLLESRPGSGVLMPSKDADRWTFPEGHPRGGEPRLSAASLAYAIGARNWQKGPPAEDDPSADVDPPFRNDDSGIPETDSAIPESPFRNPGKPVPESRNGHIEERAEEESGRMKKSTQDARADDEPFIPTVPPDGPPEVVGPGKDSPEATALEAWALQFGTDPNGASYGFWAREQCALSPASWARLLIERKVVGASRRPSIFVLTKIMADWRAGGGPEYRAARRGDGRAVAPARDYGPVHRAAPDPLRPPPKPRAAARRPKGD